MTRKVSAAITAATIASVAGCTSMPEYTPKDLPEASETLTSKVTAHEDTIAIIVNSPDYTREGEEETRWRSLVRTYGALRKQDVPAENIFILYGNGTFPADGVDRFDTLRPIEDRLLTEVNTTEQLFPSTKEYFERITSNLKGGVIDNNDDLLLIFQEHGDNDGVYFRTTVGAKGEVLSPQDLVDTVNDIRARNTMVVVSACGSGVFTDPRLQYAPGTVVLASSPRGKLSWTGPHFDMASAYITAFGDVTNNDLDGDGRVTANEAFLRTTRTSWDFQKDLMPRIEDGRWSIPARMTRPGSWIRESAGVTTHDDEPARDEKIRRFLVQSTDCTPQWQSYQGDINFSPGRGYRRRNSSHR